MLYGSHGQDQYPTILDYSVQESFFSTICTYFSNGYVPLEKMVLNLSKFSRKHSMCFYICVEGKRAVFFNVDPPA